MENLQIECKKETFIKRDVGNELLKIELLYPIFTSNDKIKSKVEQINRFYDEIVNNCKNYACGALFDKIASEYGETGLGGRRKFKKYIYRLECGVRDEDEEGVLCVRIEAKLLRSGRVIGSNCLLHKWDVRRALLFSPKKKKETKKRDKRLDKRERVL